MTPTDDSILNNFKITWFEHFIKRKFKAQVILKNHLKLKHLSGLFTLNKILKLLNLNKIPIIKI